MLVLVWLFLVWFLLWAYVLMHVGGGTHNRQRWYVWLHCTMEKRDAGNSSHDARMGRFWGQTTKDISFPCGDTRMDVCIVGNGPGAYGKQDTTSRRSMSIPTITDITTPTHGPVWVVCSILVLSVLRGPDGVTHHIDKTPLFQKHHEGCINGLPKSKHTSPNQISTIIYYHIIRMVDATNLVHEG